MKSIVSFAFLVFVALSLKSTFVFSQKTSTVYYTYYENGKVLDGRSSSVLCNNFSSEMRLENGIERYRIDYQKRTVYKLGTYDSKIFVVETPFDSLVQAIETKISDTLLGFACKKVEFNLFSNKIEVWYTDKIGVFGSPSISFCPPNGLVLKYVVNGNRTILASKIEKTKWQESINFANCEFVSDAKYTGIQIKSRYSTIPIFTNEQINFENLQKPILPLQSEVVYRLSKGNVLLKKIKLPKNAGKGLFFIQLTDRSNGDAYDRVGSVFCFSTKNEKIVLDAFVNGLDKLPEFIGNNESKYQGIVSNQEFKTPVELMRFFTPFGVGHFNKKRVIDGYNWSDSAVYKQEVTSLIPTDDDEIWVGVYIGNYDKGGHKISLELNFYPEDEMPERNAYILPLFSTVNTMEAIGQNYGSLFLNDSLKMDFSVNDSIQNLRLLFTTTGHGGWENGDEFNPKCNQIWIDGVKVFEHSPWRSDCGTYRTLNPASGNFPDGLSSSDLSRSNWCPGTLTPPFIIPLKNLAKGNHTIKVIIDQGQPEGGSFSHWCVSGVIVGEKK